MGANGSFPALRRKASAPSGTHDRDTTRLGANRRAVGTNQYRHSYLPTALDPAAV